MDGVLMKFLLLFSPLFTLSSSSFPPPQPPNGAVALERRYSVRFATQRYKKGEEVTEQQPLTNFSCYHPGSRSFNKFNFNWKKNWRTDKFLLLKKKHAISFAETKKKKNEKIFFLLIDAKWSENDSLFDLGGIFLWIELNFLNEFNSIQFQA